MKILKLRLTKLKPHWLLNCTHTVVYSWPKLILLIKSFVLFNLIQNLFKKWKFSIRNINSSIYKFWIGLNEYLILLVFYFFRKNCITFTFTYFMSKIFFWKYLYIFSYAFNWKINFSPDSGDTRRHFRGNFIF